MMNYCVQGIAIPEIIHRVGIYGAKGNGDVTLN